LLASRPGHFTHMNIHYPLDGPHSQSGPFGDHSMDVNVHLIEY